MPFWIIVFEYKITSWICVLVLLIHKGYLVVKKMMWNVCIKAFLYTKLFKSHLDIFILLDKSFFEITWIFTCYRESEKMNQDINWKKLFGKGVIRIHRESERERWTHRQLERERER